MDSTSSILEHQRTYYFNGTYDEVISNDQPKPPPMLPHGDDVHAVPQRSRIDHHCNQKWSERRKNRDKKRKRMTTSASDKSVTVKKVGIVKPVVSSEFSGDSSGGTMAASFIDDDYKDARKALPASEIPEGFPEDLVFRTMAAYATLRTLSVQLRLSPFTPTAFLRAIYLPYPNRLLGSVHVHILRILLHNLQMGYNWKDSATVPPPLDVVKKRRIDHIKWPLRAGDNLRYLDMHTWPIFYDDYCHLTADVLYASLYDILDHVDARTLHLHGIIDKFSTTPNEMGPKHVPRFLDDTHQDDVDDVVIIDSDEDYKLEEEDDDNDAFDYDDESYGQSKKKKRKGKSSKAKQRKSIPKSSTVTPGSAGITSTSSNSAKVMANVNPMFPTSYQFPNKSYSFPQPPPRAMGLPPAFPPHLATSNHQQRQQYLYENEQRHRMQHPSAIQQHTFGMKDFKIHNVSPFYRPHLINKGPMNHQHFQQPHGPTKQSDHQLTANNNPILSRPVESESIRGNLSHQDQIASHKPAGNNATLEERPRDNVEFTVLHDVDSSGKQRDIIVLDSPNSSSEDNNVKNSADDVAVFARSRRLRKNPKSRSFAGSKELHFFQERYGLKSPPDVPNFSVTSTDGNDEIDLPFRKRSRDDDSDPRLQLDDSIGLPVQIKYTVDKKSSNAGHSNGIDHSRTLVDPSSQETTTGINGASHHSDHLHQRSSCTDISKEPFHHSQPQIYHNRPNFYEVEVFARPAPYQPVDFTSDAQGQLPRVPPQLDNSLVPLRPLPIQRTNLTIANSDDAIDTSIVNAPVEGPLAPPQQPATNVSKTESVGMAALSNGVRVPSLPNITKIGGNDGTVVLQKDKESINGGHGTRVNDVSIKAAERQVSLPNPRTLHNAASTTTNIVALARENPKSDLQSDNLSDASSDAASRLRAFIRGHYKLADSTVITKNKDDATLNENYIVDSVTFPIDESENWSHFVPLKAMRMGAAYHTLSVNDKLTILEFLIDELLSVSWIANEFTLRHDANASNTFPYGPKPSDEEMRAVKEADGDQHDELCKVCNEIGDVVCCDGCVAVYHGECAGFLNASKLPDIWYCPECAVKDPSSFGPLRSMKKSEVDWFSIADINAADRSDRGPDISNDFKIQNNAVKFLAVHGYVFCQNDSVDLNSSRISKMKPSLQKVLTPPNLKGILKSFGQGLYSKWPIEQIPIDPTALWKSVSEPGTLYFKRKECFDPTVYENKYCRAPILLEGVRRSKESSVYEEKILNDSSTNSGMADLLTCDVSRDGAIVASISSNPKAFDVLQIIKSYLLKFENDLSKAFLLDEFWDAREMAQNALSWKESVKRCSAIRSLSRLLLRLVDATHHRAFIESWTHSVVAKPKEGVPIQSAENGDVGSTGFNLQDEALHRLWTRSRLCHLPTLLLKTSKYLIEIGQKPGTVISANSPKRKSTIRKPKQDELYSSHIKNLESGTTTANFGDSESKPRNRRECDSIGTHSSSSSTKVDSRLKGYIQRRIETFIRESKALVHREIHWPVAGKKLFDPIGYLPALAVRYLGRNGGAHFAPFVDYSTLHEVGQVAYCHIWRKRVLLCTQFEHLLELVRMLVMHMNQQTINKCASIANGGKTTKGKNSTTIHRTQRDLLTGMDYHLVGLGQPVSKPRRWESSSEIDLGVFVQERVRRSKLHVDAALNKTRIEAEAMLPVLALPKPQNKTVSAGSTGQNTSRQKGIVLPHYTGTGYQNATMLAANIITAHIEETKKLMLMHGAGLSTEHMIVLRKKTDFDLSQVFVGNFSYVDENGRIEMMMKAEESARESMNQSTMSLPQSNPSITASDSRKVYQAAPNPGPVAHIVSTDSKSTPSIDLNEIMKSGSPYDWSKHVVQHHKEFARLLYLKYGNATFPDAELEGSRRQCIGNLNTIFNAAGLRYAYNQISAVIKEAENEARADFLNKSTALLGGHNASFLSPQQPPTVPVHSNTNNLELQHSLTVPNNAKNPFVDSGAAYGVNSNNVLQSQNNFQATTGIPAHNANVTSNVIFQATGSNSWYSQQQQPINSNSTVQPWQIGNSGSAAPQAGTYLSHPQHMVQLPQRSSVLPYNQSLSTQGNNVAYTSPSLQQQQWLSSQQQLVTPASANLYGQQNQLQQQSYNTGTPWSSTMSSSIYAQQQQATYHPQQNQQWPQQQQLQYQQQDDKSSNTGNNWYPNASR